MKQSIKMNNEVHISLLTHLCVSSSFDNYSGNNEDDCGRPNPTTTLANEDALLAQVWSANFSASM